MLIELASAIRSRRLTLGLSERQLSSNLGIEILTLRSIEQGAIDPDVQLLYAIARELCLTAAKLVSKAESLMLASKDVQRQMLHSLRTRRQLESLEQQHDRLFQQLERLKRQKQTLESCRNLIDSTQTAIRLVPPLNRGDCVQRRASIKQRLEGQHETFSATMGRLALIKQACDEHEMFIQRRRANRVHVVR
jgi:transcriptional regulator with XRE-family HTH domain